MLNIPTSVLASHINRRIKIKPNHHCSKSNNEPSVSTAKKFLVLLAITAVSFNVYASNDSVSIPLNMFYKQFTNELSFYKFESMVTTLVKFSRIDHKPLNSDLSNINNIDATIGDHEQNTDENWKTFLYHYSMSPYNSNQTVYNMGYSRYDEMPIGGFLQPHDVNESVIKSLIPIIKQSYPQYTSNMLLEISVSRDIRYGVYYEYLFAKPSSCNQLTYSIEAASVINVAEVNCILK